MYFLSQEALYSGDTSTKFKVLATGLLKMIKTSASATATAVCDVLLCYTLPNTTTTAASASKASVLLPYWLQPPHLYWHCITCTDAMCGNAAALPWFKTCSVSCITVRQSCSVLINSSHYLISYYSLSQFYWKFYNIWSHKLLLYKSGSGYIKSTNVHKYFVKCQQSVLCFFILAKMPSSTEVS